MELKIGGVYMHYEGALYQVTDIAEHVETGEKLVIYYSHATGVVFAEPSQMFCSKVNKVRYPNAMQEHRFELIEDGE